MAGLLRDRYFEYAPERAWDLVTGEAVAATSDEEGEQTPGPEAAAFIELLDHGTDGSPRLFERPINGTPWRAHARLMATVARRRGYVPLAVDVFLRTRTRLADDLRTRAMVLIARPETAPEALRTALLHAAAISPGPHVLVVAPPRRARADRQWRAAEARPAYSSDRIRLVPRATLGEEVRQLMERASRSGALVWRGRHASAERLIREAAAALVRRRAQGPAAEAYIAVGRLLLERGRVKDAEAAFAEAAALAEGCDIQVVVSARLWQAAARTDAGQLTAAEALCRSVLLNPAHPDEQARAEAALGRVLLWQGRTAEAAALPFIGQPSASPYVSATAVRLLIESGDLFRAGVRARELLTATADADPVGRVIALGAHLRVLLASGDLTLAAGALEAVAQAARAARTPLRLARMRLLWSLAMRRAGDTKAADREARALSRMRTVMPPLLRTAIDRSMKSGVTVPAHRGDGPSNDGSAVGLVLLAQGSEDDSETLSKILDLIMRNVGASRVELWTDDAGPPTAVVTRGAGLRTRLGPRALEAGSVIGPEVVESGWEVAVPVRLGSQLLGALTARWPADRPHAGEWMGLLMLACAVAAPRLESFRLAARQVTAAAAAIPELVGVSAGIAEVRRAVARAAGAPFSVLIEGESGVGKELVARAIHHQGARRDRRFCDVNCAALPDDLFESELFGHARGAFTGAVCDRPGLVEEADGGTLFLDEVADLSARAQAKLLRVVQQQEVRRVGESFSRKVDVRFVSAANRDLGAECGKGHFRQDLLYRLDVIRIRIPPLRERPEDIPLLAQHFWAAATARMHTQAALSHAVLAALARYHWPGNVRELQNVLAALAVDAPARGQIRAARLPSIITGATLVTSARLGLARAQWERRFVEIAIARAGGNRARAARELGLSRQGLIKVMSRLGL